MKEDDAWRIKFWIIADRDILRDGCQVGLSETVSISPEFCCARLAQCWVPIALEHATQRVADKESYFSSDRTPLDRRPERGMALT